jgi:hypothetical protein
MKEAGSEKNVEHEGPAQKMREKIGQQFDEGN